MDTNSPDDLHVCNERDAFVRLDPEGFFIRHPPKPHELDSYITSDEELFQTIHMGGAVIDRSRWKLVITGLVREPYVLDLRTLQEDFTAQTITSFHECFGSPLKPPTEALWRIGNVRWTGVRLKDILQRAQPLTGATHVWTEGLDRGEFAGVKANSYQKDLPLEKALQDEVLVAYAINGQPLSLKRGGPVRLAVPGWFGTNSTKWLSKLELQDRRAPGPYTTRFYNSPDPETGAIIPVWQVEPNSMITKPMPDAELTDPSASVQGWAWSPDGIISVDVSIDDGQTWESASVDNREGFSWQRFHAGVHLQQGLHTIVARATGTDGRTQPLQGHRNHCHRIMVQVSGS